MVNEGGNSTPSAFMKTNISDLPVRRANLRKEWEWLTLTSVGVLAVLP